MEVKKEGFTLKYTAVSPKMIFGISVAFGAISDPNIVIAEYNTKDVGELATGANKYRIKYVDIPFGRKFEKTPVVALFLLGV